MLGETKLGRDHLVEHASSLALRVGPWKFIPAGPGAKVLAQTGIESGKSSEPQLYDLSIDPGETKNVASDHLNKVQAMSAQLEELRNAGKPRALEKY